MSLSKVRFMLLTAVLMMTANHAFAIVPLPGYGGKSTAMAGVGVATPMDTFVMISNPAGLSFIEDRYDLGLAYLKPSDKIKIRDNLLVPHGNFKSSPDVFAPALGIKKDFKCLSVGLCLFGRGTGVNYGRSVGLFGTSKLRFEYNQYIIKPAVSWNFMENQSFGVGINYALSLLRQDGAQNFKPGSQAPNNVTNKGFDYKGGLGYQVGWVGKFFDRLKLGLAYDSPIYTHSFQKYRGLIADHGKVNGPAIFGAGVTFDATCRLTVAFEFQKYYWKKIKAIHNPQSFTALNGSTDGSGFGWKNENLYRFGVSYQYDDHLTLRGGFAYIRPFIPSSQLFLNLDASTLLPTSALTAGFTWAWNRHEINCAYGYGFQRHFDGDVAFLSGGGKIKTKTAGQMIGVFYGYKL